MHIPNFFRPKNPRLAVAFFCWAILAVSGCGHGTDYSSSTVSGTVTIDGRPVAKGFITFNPTKQGQGPSAGGKIAEGKYQCERVPVGKQRVTFQTQAGETKTITDVATGQKREVPQNILPPQYLSGVDADIQPDRMTLDFPLVSKPQSAASRPR